MSYDHHPHDDGHRCPSCDYAPFSRNAYWTGKLMLARDFVDEQKYAVEKLRHHNQLLHGVGVVCGLKVVAHPKEACRDRYVGVEPGTAVDCCGHDIVVPDKDYVDLWSIPELKKLKDANDDQPHTLRICVKYRECESEPVPKLYDECGCDDDTCAPNRILESYTIHVLLGPFEDPQDEPNPANCGDLWLKSLKGCPRCDQPDCLVLATIKEWRVGAPIVDADLANPPANAVKIDNSTRTILPSVQLVKEVIDCILGQGPGGGGVGGAGPAGKGIDFVTVATGAPGSAATATLLEDTPALGKRTLHLVIPAGKDGAPGGPGLDDVRLNIVPCGSPKVAEIVIDPGGKRVLELEIPTNCGAKFTHICQINWVHAKGLAARDLRVAFDGPIVLNDINEHTFIVERGNQDRKTRLTCWCEVPGRRKVMELSRPCDLGSEIVVANTQPNLVVFEPDPDHRFEHGATYRVTIKGDLIRDLAGKAVDANHLPKWVSGGRPTGDGIEGGTFESWFQTEG